MPGNALHRNCVNHPSSWNSLQRERASQRSGERTPGWPQISGTRRTSLQRAKAATVPFASFASKRKVWVEKQVHVPGQQKWKCRQDKLFIVSIYVYVTQKSWVCSSFAVLCFSVFPFIREYIQSLSSLCLCGLCWPLRHHLPTSQSAMRQLGHRLGVPTKAWLQNHKPQDFRCK